MKFVVACLCACPRRAVLVALLTVWTCSLTAAVKPDGTAARQFAVKLQAEFATKKSGAFVERVDGDAFNERLFGTRNVAEEHPWLDWPEGPPAALTKSMVGLDVFPYFAGCRVVLDDDVRTLDCDFLTERYEFNTARFFLVQDAAGDIRIADFQWGGDALTKSEMVRHTLILQGHPFSRLRNDEERKLAALSRKNGALFSTMVTCFAKGDAETSFQILKTLPPEVANTRICRHYLTCQIGGSKSAAAALQKLLRDEPDQFDPVLRFKIAISQGDRRAALAACTDILSAQQNPSLFRCFRAGMLLEEGRAADAYALAYDTMQLQPRSGMAYAAALRAAVALNRLPEALAVLTAWCRIVPPSNIDAVVQSIPSLKDFCSSPQYSGWKTQMTSEAPTHPPSSL